MLLFEKNISIKTVAKKCGKSDYWMGKKISSEQLNLKEIKIILELLDMKFEDVF
jgi:hypothetical protein